MAESINTKILIDQLGLPGLPESLRILPHFEGDTLTDEQRMKDLSLRDFKLQALLAKFPSNTQNIDSNIDKEDGNSFLLARADADTYRIEKDGHIINILKNKNNELSMVEYNCQAVSFEEAHQSFFAKANPWIDYIAYSANCPLYLSRLRTEDVKNQVTLVNYTGPYQNSYLNSSLVPIFPELVPVYALYREAKNSNSLFYRFLSYFKIMEGFKTKLNIELNKRMQVAGIPLNKDVVPEKPHIDTVYKKYIGGSVWKIYDEVFNPEFRIAVAHYMKENGDIMTISDMLHQQKFTAILPVIELCVRALIDKYNQVLVQLYQAGK